MTIEIRVPELGESVLEATVKEWLKKEGDRVAVGEALVELETDKVNLEVGAERNGVLSRIERQEGEDVKVGDTLGVIEEITQEQDGQAAPPQKEEKTESGTAVKTGMAYPEWERQGAVEPEKAEQDHEKINVEETRATPVANRVARDLNVDLAQVQGTGPGGRVTREDVEGFIKAAGCTSCR
jgi:2-oxoglutarate dehydrogenase E2 component (dihydrolipoamide succinyltransferase)